MHSDRPCTNEPGLVCKASLNEGEERRAESLLCACVCFSLLSPPFDVGCLNLDKGSDESSLRAAEDFTLLQKHPLTLLSCTQRSWSTFIYLMLGHEIRLDETVSGWATQPGSYGRVCVRAFQVSLLFVGRVYTKQTTAA